jgi:hypothetical protein
MVGRLGPRRAIGTSFNFQFFVITHPWIGDPAIRLHYRCMNVQATAET